MFKQFHPNAWFNISLDMWGLGVDSAAVIALSLIHI